MSATRAKKNPKVTVYDAKGRMAGEFHLPSEIFYAPVNKRLLAVVQNAYAGNLRSGTADTKTRAEVRGGGKKPWKQKGTGRARHGSIRSPIWRGGGTVFGPQPRDYYTRIPLQLRRQALISALSQKNAQGKLMLVDQLALSKPKTKDCFQILEALKLDGCKTLCVVEKRTPELTQATRNLGYCLHLEEARHFTAYDVMKNDRLLLEKKSVPVLEAWLLGAGQKAESTEQEREEALR